MKRAILVLAALAATLPATAAAAQEFVVTAQMRDDDDETVPLIRMKRTADFAILEVRVTGDTRDADQRREEIYGMVRKAIELAPRHGVELAIGDLVVEPLALDNYRNLTLSPDRRPDTNVTRFYVTARLAPGMDPAEALARITRFVKAVPTVGRAQMEAEDELALSVVDPNQYLGAIVAMIAEDANATAASFGPDYGVTVSGLHEQVRWVRASLTEVYLYLPIRYSVVPRDGASAAVD